MIITDKDLNLSLRFIDISENLSDCYLFIVPDLSMLLDFGYVLYRDYNTPIKSKIDAEFKEDFMKYIGCKYIKYKRIKEDYETPCYSERFDILFDVDESEYFYFKLKYY